MNIKLRIWASKGQDLKDQVVNAAPKFALGTSLKIEVGVGNENSYTPRDISTLTSLTLAIFSIDKATKYIEKTVAAAAFGALTESTWRNQTAQHASFTMSSAETNLTEGDYWLVIYGTDNSGETLPFAYGKIQVENSGCYPVGTPTPVTNPYQVPYLDMLCPDDATIHRVYLRLDQGMYMLEPDQNPVP